MPIVCCEIASRPMTPCGTNWSSKLAGRALSLSPRRGALPSGVLLLLLLLLLLENSDQLFLVRYYGPVGDVDAIW
jgi:hypothetical protein